MYFNKSRLINLLLFLVTTALLLAKSDNFAIIVFIAMGLSYLLQRIEKLENQIKDIKKNSH